MRRPPPAAHRRARVRGRHGGVRGRGPLREGFPEAEPRDGARGARCARRMRARADAPSSPAKRPSDRRAATRTPRRPRTSVSTTAWAPCSRAWDRRQAATRDGSAPARPDPPAWMPANTSVFRRGRDVSDRDDEDDDSEPDPDDDAREWPRTATPPTAPDPPTNRNVGKMIWSGPLGRRRRRRRRRRREGRGKDARASATRTRRGVSGAASAGASRSTRGRIRRRRRLRHDGRKGRHHLTVAAEGGVGVVWRRSRTRG